MTTRLTQLLFTSLPFLLSVVIAGPAKRHTNKGKKDKVINTDVVIIGGGATGTFAAVRIRDDFKKKVVLIEQKDQLVE